MDYTTPITTTFELQRTTIEQSQQALQRSFELQQSVNQAVVDSFETQEAAQQRAVELQQEAVHSALDAIEANVPGATNVPEVREAVDEQYDLLLDNHAEAFEAVASEFEEGVAAYDDLAEDYIAALDEQIDLLVEAHEEIEAQSVEGAEQLTEQFEEL